MQTLSHRRPHKTSSEKARILTAYGSSQLTQKEFAAQQGIGLSTFGRWLRESGPTRVSAPPAGRAGLLEVPNLFAAKSAGPTCRVHFPRGLVLEVAGGFPPDELRALTQLLHSL